MEELEERLSRIIGDRQRGCSEILIDSLELLKDVERFYGRNRVAEVAGKISRAHSGMIGLVRTLEKAVKNGVNEVLNDVARANELTSENLSEMAEGKCAVTVSRSGIVERGLRKASRVYVMISRPGEEGRIMAETLGAYTDVRVIEDAEVGVYLRRSDLAVCGADAISAKGFLNKVGTLPLMCTAKHTGVERFVATPLYKLVDKIVETHPFEFVDATLASLITEKGLTSWLSLSSDRIL